MKKREYAFILHRISGTELTNPQNKVTQFLNSSEVNTVVNITSNHNPQFGDTFEVTILYEKEVPEPENEHTPQSGETKSSQSFKKRPRPGPLR